MSRPAAAWPWIAVGIALAVVGLYAPVAGFPFVTFDDPEYVYRNPWVRGGLRRDGVAWAFTAAHAANWHPLTWLSHMLDWSLFGSWAGGHHLTSVALHALATLVLLAALVRLTRAPWESAVVAAAFALHPLRVESVAWVSERKDVLAALAWAGAMLAYARWVERPGPARYAGLLATFTAGLLAKPMVVSLPCALLLLDVWPLGRVARVGWRRLVLEKAPLLAASAVVAGVTYLVQADAGAVPSLEAQPLGARVAGAVSSYATYLWKTVWPFGLAAFYPPRATVDAGAVLAAAGVLLAITALVTWQRRERPWLAVGWLWYVGTLVPVIGVVRAGDQAMADRFTYLPSIGLAVMAAWTVGELARRGVRERRLATVAVLAVLAAWTVRSRDQLATWRDSRTLYAHALAVTTGNHLAHGNLGLLLLEQGRADEAMAHFDAAVAARPGAAKVHLNRGAGLAATGRRDEALAAYETALRLDPRLAVAHYNVGVELAARGRLDEAEARYREAIRLDPGYALPHVNLGLALAGRGRWAEAIAHYRAAVALDPDLPAAYNNLAVALEATGAVEEAVAAYRTATRLEPGDPRARLNLGAVLLGLGRAHEAAAEFREIVRASPGTPEAYAGLGEALEATGDRAGAAAAFERALERRPEWPAVRARAAALRAAAETPVRER